MIIDKWAYRSRLSKTDTVLKLFFAISCLFMCILSDNIIVSVITVLTMIFIIIFIGKTSPKIVFKLMLIPISFIITGSIAIIISIGDNPGGMYFYTEVFGKFIGIGIENTALAVKTVFKCFGAVSCMYFLSLTTPMNELFSVLYRSIIPDFIVETAELIYRYIFVLYDEAQKIYSAQSSRLGYSNLRIGYKSAAQLISMVFVRALKQSEKTYIAMESRGYNGSIVFFEEKKKKNIIHYIFVVVYLAFVLSISYIIGRYFGIG